MEIIKEGDVLFRNGEIVEINNFEIENGSGEDLEVYVFEHYKNIK